MPFLAPNAGNVKHCKLCGIAHLLHLYSYPRAAVSKAFALYRMLQSRGTVMSLVPTGRLGITSSQIETYARLPSDRKPDSGRQPLHETAMAVPAMPTDTTSTVAHSSNAPTPRLRNVVEAYMASRRFPVHAHPSFPAITNAVRSSWAGEPNQARPVTVGPPAVQITSTQAIASTVDEDDVPMYA
jgi:hypothetical protein